MGSKGFRWIQNGLSQSTLQAHLKTAKATANDAKIKLKIAKPSRCFLIANFSFSKTRTIVTNLLADWQENFNWSSNVPIKSYR